MAEVVVERRHREAAIKACYGPNPPRAALAVRDLLAPWAATGTLTHDGSPIARLGIALERIAQGYADFEAAGGATERADVIAAANEAAAMLHAEDAHYEAEALESFCDQLENGRHEGAAKRGEAGRG